MAIDFELVKEIKSRADIVDIISSYLSSVQKKGRNYVAICPFHDDHDPSMQISKEKQTFHCYVCGNGGDIFTFVQKYDKCSFEESVRKVADIINFDDPRLHSNAYKKTEVNPDLATLYNCINEVQKFYLYGINTEEGKTAKEYLNKRDISIEQRNKFSIGYALENGKLIIEYLKAKGYSLKNIEDIGISLVQTSNMNDRNSGRLIFPIKNSDGQIVGFSARRLKDDDSSKYVNSPESKLFKKSYILYNYDIAKKTCKHDGYIYLVEGFMDVLAFDTIGISSCVALMSTKLTIQHIDLLRKLRVEIRLCLDGDKPGQEAMMKIMSQLDDAKLSYRIVSKPNEIRDPDEILKQDGSEALSNFIKCLVDPFSFAINYYLNISPLDTIENRKKVIKHFIPTIRSLPTKFEQNDYIYKLSQVTNFSSQAIKDLVNENKQQVLVDNRTDQMSKSEIRTEKKYRRLVKAEQIIFEYMLVSYDTVQFFKENIKSFLDSTMNEAAKVIVSFADKNKYVSITEIITYAGTLGIDNKDKVINLLSEYSTINSKEKKYNDIILKDCKEEIDKERSNISQFELMKKACEGKSEQEKARIINDYVLKKKI